MKFTVTRQVQFGGNDCVEISRGGLDYANPDMLVPKYKGEGETYDNPVEAVEIAIEIAKKWQEECPDRCILIDHGATGGMTMPFDGCELAVETFEALRCWAKILFDKAPKCEQCGEVLPEMFYTNYETGENYCSSYCAELAADYQINIELDALEAHDQISAEAKEGGA